MGLVRNWDTGTRGEGTGVPRTASLRLSDRRWHECVLPVRWEARPDLTPVSRGKGFEQVTRLWATESHQVCALLSGSSGVGPDSQRARMGEIHPRCFILSEESWAIFPWGTDVALLPSG